MELVLGHWNDRRWRCLLDCSWILGSLRAIDLSNPTAALVQRVAPIHLAPGRLFRRWYAVLLTERDLATAVGSSLHQHHGYYLAWSVCQSRRVWQLCSRLLLPLCHAMDQERKVANCSFILHRNCARRLDGFCGHW